MRIGLVIISILLGISVTAQQFELRGNVRDAVTDEPLFGCHLTVEATDAATISDLEGDFSLLLNSKESTGFVLICQYLGYETQRVSINPDLMTATGEGYFIQIEMKGKAYELDPLQISLDNLPEIVYSSEQHSIADYEFLGENILLLVYEKRLEKASRIYLVDKQGTILDSIRIREGVKARGLKRDYADLVYLEASKGIYQIESSDIGLRMNKVDRQTYEEQVEPIVDTVGAQVYFSTWVDQFPAFDYYRYDLQDSSYSHIRQVADAFMLELCRAEFKYLTTRDKLRMYRLELETGVEKEVLTCMGTYRDGLYYDPIYAPMFVKGDSLLLFDHPGEQLFIFDTQGVALDSVPIHYHRPSKVMGNDFAKELVMDTERGVVYAIFQKAGGKCRLMQIDLSNGEIEESITLTYDYPSAIQVKDGEVHYTYRPFESSQKKYLYKESIDFH